MNQNSEFVFRPLEQELGQSLMAKPTGYHDLVDQVVTSHAIDSSMTSKHEGFHDELLHHTPFGWLQRTLAIIGQALRHDSEYRELIERWTTLTLEKSRVAHESYATYLSIKSFSPDEEAALLDRHPAEYRRYFNLLASRIDRSLGSSYLQFLVGKALVTAAFAGDAIRKLATLDELCSPQIPDAQSPDKRLALILERYEQDFVAPIHAAIDDCIRAHTATGKAPQGFDAYSERHWRSLTLEQSSSLDEAIIGRLHPLVSGITRENLALPVLDFGDGGALISPLIQLFIDVNELKGRPPSRGSPPEHELKRWRLGAVQIANDGVATSDVPTRLHAAHQIDEFVRAPNIAITRSLCRSRADVDWRLLTFRDDGGIAYEMNDDVLVKALSLYRPMRLAEGNTDVVETTVFGVDTVRSFPPLYEEYEDTLTHADHVARNSTTFWYMGGNFVEWIDSKLFDGDVMSYTLSIGVDEATAQSHFEQLPDRQWILKPESRNSTKLPPRLFVLRNSLLTGYFVRLMPGYESYKIGWKVRDPEHRRFPDDERHYLRSVSTKLISALFLTWPRI